MRVNYNESTLGIIMRVNYNESKLVHYNYLQLP